jgi:outer membrane immunogenic protein
MLKIAAITAAIATLALSGAANAADLPVKAYKAPPPPPPVFSWTGCYLGANVGYGWGPRSIDAFDDRTRATDVGNWDFNGSGVVGGGQVGCNWQTGALVFGLEGDFQGTGVRSHNHGQPFDGETNMNFDMPWLATARGRIGYAGWDRVLVYATGGLAVASVKYEADDFANNGTDYIESRTRVGWTVGAGIETALADPRWSIKAEYLYVGFSDQNYITNDPGFTTNVKSNTNIVRVGLNYRLGQF